MNLDEDSDLTQIDTAELKIQQGIQTQVRFGHYKSEKTRTSSFFPLTSDFVELGQKL
ncbi:hypothetical protein COO91_09180 (plasmid) [Nostoc flagelliforme CCNUN1]|uniref:Uncharacterized protein n=1 Tax=Nostoc flagelliforme CCNUN1 TaxID=2038116 RepID=A0A2K8T5P9_9NOSO|nr:hypothetical protein [Nostoc flagelliforme]AUB43024.1 hypothetical protein COO91_09180 [Nostoc flagelliforme CCNUN1]